ncbi:MAG: toll/interleukin-1 receptor domain-containing protein [Anaerolineae bacterium]|nr:toll/interleukin-1 receptor domain-containing protein [Anaerolineae bacterium]
MGHIFISYSKKDIVYAEKLINALRREGFNPWVDIEGLGAGTSWQTRLQKQIYTCDAYILIMSKNARSSKWVPDELVTAKTRGKPIFPLLLEDTQLFLAIQTIQFEDVRGGKMPSEAFYRRLATVTSRRKKASQKVDSVRLTEEARKQKVEAAAQKASYYLSKLSSNVKDVIAVASKISSDTYQSVANSEAVKRISSKVKGKTKPVKKKK